MGTAIEPFEQASPQCDDPLRPVLAPEDNFVAFAEARTLQARGKSARGSRSFCVRIGSRSISVVVHEKYARPAETSLKKSSKVSRRID